MRLLLIVFMFGLVTIGCERKAEKPTAPALTGNFEWPIEDSYVEIQVKRLRHGWSASLIGSSNGRAVLEGHWDGPGEVVSHMMSHGYHPIFRETIDDDTIFGLIHKSQK